MNKIELMQAIVWKLWFFSLFCVFLNGGLWWWSKYREISIKTYLNLHFLFFSLWGCSIIAFIGYSIWTMVVMLFTPWV